MPARVPDKESQGHREQYGIRPQSANLLVLNDGKRALEYTFYVQTERAAIRRPAIRYQRSGLIALHTLGEVLARSSDEPKAALSRFRFAESFKLSCV